MGANRPIEVTGFDEVSRLELLVLRRPAQAFVNIDNIASQWRSLQFRKSFFFFKNFFIFN